MTPRTEAGHVPEPTDLRAENRNRTVTMTGEQYEAMVAAIAEREAVEAYAAAAYAAAAAAAAYAADARQREKAWQSAHLLELLAR